MAPPIYRRRGVLLVAVLATFVIVAGTATAYAAPRPYGASVGTWGGRWWQWAYSIPSAENPLFDETGTQCLTQQPERGFIFLAGVFNQTGTTERDCTIPAGRGVFMPLINVECSSLEADPFFGDDPASLSACLDHYSVTDAWASLDGTPLRVYQERSGMYAIRMPSSGDNLLGAPAGVTGVSMADGAYAGLTPLPVGTYDIHFGGTLQADAFAGGWSFSLDITYHLTVR